VKICILIPCLMVENNRKANYEAMEFAKTYGADEIVVYDQEFKQEDYFNGFTYIGHQRHRQGFVKARNELLRWFYNSDYDYAFWIDANEKVSTTCINEVETIFCALRNGLEANCIVATMGIQVSDERIKAKKRKDYFTKVYLLRSKSGYHWMHGLTMRNFKKAYGAEVYIDERCDPRKGTSEDTYFIRLLRRLFECQLCPTLIVSKPSNKMSTWMENKDSYDYPRIDYPILDEYIRENLPKYKGLKGVKVPDFVCLERKNTQSLSYIKPYRAKRRKK